MPAIRPGESLAGAFVPSVSASGVIVVSMVVISMVVVSIGGGSTVNGSLQLLPFTFSAQMAITWVLSTSKSTRV